MCLFNKSLTNAGTNVWKNYFPIIRPDCIQQIDFTYAKMSQVLQFQVLVRVLFKYDYFRVTEWLKATPTEVVGDYSNGWIHASEHGTALL